MAVYKFTLPGTFVNPRTVYKSMLAGNTAFVNDAYDSIATLTGTGSSATITFSSIPDSYVHLQLRYIGRVANADTGDNMFIQFNSDTSSNYSWHYLEGDGATPFAGGAANQTKILAGRVAAANAAANIMGAGVIDILDYANTNKYKTVRDLAGLDRNGSGNVRFDSGNWRNTNAINSITITNGSSTNFTSTSTFALYGMRT